VKKIFCLMPFLFLAAFALQCFRSSGHPETRDGVEAALARLAHTYSGTIGVAAKNLDTGELVTVNADSLFSTASAIKVPVLVEFFTQLKEGRLRRDSLVVLADTNKWGGSGVLQWFAGTSRIKLIDAVMLMITLSDNTATNLVIDALGNDHEAKLAAVNNRMETLGLHQTRLLNKVMSWATKKKTYQSLRFGIGYSSPNDMIRLLEMMVKGELVDKRSSEEMIGLMHNQQDATMAPRQLPFSELKPGDSIVVANKTGSTSQVKVDVGIVFAKTRYVYAIFCDQSKDTGEMVDNKTILAAARASRLLYDYFQRERAH
jgi:beta-lactamase class A